MRKELKQPGVAGFRVKCREHGGKPWRGDLVCEKCGVVHLIDDAMGHPSIDGNGGMCTCGAAMFPARDEKGEPMPNVPFYGRIACHDCAQREHAKQEALKSP